MLEGLRPYTNYKDMGSPWFGDIPAHWQMRRTKTLFQERVQKGFPDEPLLTATQSKGVVRKGDYEVRTVTVSKDFHLLKLVEVGDFVISLRSFQGGIELAHYRGIISPAYTVLEPKNDALRFYYKHFFKSKSFINSLLLFVTGIREGQNIDYARLGRAYLPMPPQEEQEAIGKFLDYANGKLDRAIRTKRKTIALLNEQKQAIIHRAVTRGLDTSTTLKSSDNAWLGDVPASWNIRPLWTISEIRNELNPKNLPLLSVFLNMGVILYEQGGGQVHAPSLDLSNYQVVRKGDFVLNNQQAWRGSVGVSAHEGIISPAYFVLKLDDCFDPVFANYLFRSRAMVDQYVASSKGVGDIQRTIFWPFLRRALVPIPDITEQIEIVKYLTKETSKLDVSISSITREISLLTEYRTRLISDVVTGKLDVREAAKNLTEETMAEPVENIGELEEQELEEAA